MNNEEAKTLNIDFEKFCKNHEIKCAVAYLASAKDNNAVMLYKDIDNNELFHAAGSIILHLSQTLNVPHKEILNILADGITTTLADSSTLKN